MDCRSQTEHYLELTMYSEFRIYIHFQSISDHGARTGQGLSLIHSFISEYTMHTQCVWVSGSERSFLCVRAIRNRGWSNLCRWNLPKFASKSEISVGHLTQRPLFLVMDLSIWRVVRLPFICHDYSRMWGKLAAAHTGTIARNYILPCRDRPSQEGVCAYVPYV
jgi:hypothetical protein